MTLHQKRSFSTTIVVGDKQPKSRSVYLTLLKTLTGLWLAAGFYIYILLSSKALSFKSAPIPKSILIEDFPILDFSTPMDSPFNVEQFQLLYDGFFKYIHLFVIYILQCLHWTLLVLIEIAKAQPVGPGPGPGPGPVVPGPEGGHGTIILLLIAAFVAYKMMINDMREMAANLASQIAAGAQAAAEAAARVAAQASSWATAKAKALWVYTRILGQKTGALLSKILIIFLGRGGAGETPGPWTGPVDGPLPPVDGVFPPIGNGDGGYVVEEPVGNAPALPAPAQGQLGNVPGPIVEELPPIDPNALPIQQGQGAIEGHPGAVALLIEGPHVAPIVAPPVAPTEAPAGAEEEDNPSSRPKPTKVLGASFAAGGLANVEPANVGLSAPRNLGNPRFPDINVPPLPERLPPVSPPSSSDGASSSKSDNDPGANPGRRDPFKK